MDLNGVIQRARRITAVRADTTVERAAIESALCAATQLRSWLAASEAELSGRLAGLVTFPEKAIADCTRSSLGEATKTKARNDTLVAVPSFGSALDAGAVTAGHVDAITRAGAQLEPELRNELFDRVAGLVDVATVATVREFGRRLDFEVKSIRRDDGIARLERQQRATRLRTWTDADGMVCLSGRFDPITGIRIVSRLDAELQARYAETVPASCPADPIDKQQHLLALSLAAIVSGDGVAVRAGRPEYVVVIDTSQPDGGGGPLVDWGIPIEVPQTVLCDLIGAGDVHTVVVRNGVVLHAPGALGLGRTTRLANQAQRRALRGLYSTCAVPGCSVRYDRCKLHHVIWWRNGGRTDLDNLLPVCAQHHTRLHTEAWELTLGPERRLTIRFPDGSVLSTGPPSRRAA